MGGFACSDGVNFAALRIRRTKGQAASTPATASDRLSYLYMLLFQIADIPETGTGSAKVRGDLHDPSETRVGFPERAACARFRKKPGAGRRLRERGEADKVLYDEMSIVLDDRSRAAPTSAMDKGLHIPPNPPTAMEIGRPVAWTKTGASAALTTLDRVQVGPAIAAQHGDAIVRNEGAKRIIGLSDAPAISWN